MMMVRRQGWMALCLTMAGALATVQGNAQAESVLRFIDSKQTLLTAARVLTPSSTFLRVEGAENDRIIIDGGDLSKALTPVAFENGAKRSSVKLRI